MGMLVESARGVVILALVACLAVGAAGATPEWFERPFAVELVTTSPAGEETRGALYVGDHRMRVDASEDEIPYVVLYAFEPGAVVMHMLDPIGTTVMTFRFAFGDVVELDVLLMGAIVLPPRHPQHPCATHPEQASCVDEGLEPLGDALAERWTIELSDGFGYTEVFALWADEEDGRILRTEYPDGYRIDFVGHEFGPQPPELFEIPAEYEAP